jgi:hypothetical protein
VSFLALELRQRLHRLGSLDHVRRCRGEQSQMIGLDSRQFRAE